MAHLTVVLTRSVLSGRRRFKVTELFNLLLLIVKVALAALVFLLSVQPLLLSLLRVICVSSWRRVILAQSSSVVLHSLLLLSIVVATLFLDPLLFIGILLVLSLQIAFQLAELGFDLVFPILANHLDGSKPFFSLSQFVLFLLFGTASLLNIYALIDSPPVSLSHLEVVLMTSLCARCSCPTRVHCRES